MAERRSTRIYYTDYQQKSEVMRAAPQRITTRLDDRQTVSAVLDLAQARGWQTIRLRGSDSFKRAARQSRVHPHFWCSGLDAAPRPPI